MNDTLLHVLVLVVAVVVSVPTGSWVTRGVLALASRRGARAPGGGPTSAAATDALRGGTWIGRLERLVITGSIVAGFPAAVAVVVAIKGLGRYPELKKDNPEASERFVIGTLASFAWAGVCGALGLVVIDLVQG